MDWMVKMLARFMWAWEHRLDNLLDKIPGYQDEYQNQYINWVRRERRKDNIP